ncbi:MAG: heme-binding protein [Leadbetterella sp.]|nr:heme-binding protein [Leadbetterella sp.]
MKITLIVIGIIALIIVIIQIYTSMATNKSESQVYKVIQTEKEFEIRYYPTAIMAMITSDVKSYKELGNTGFRKLAGYIFGGNKDQKQIAMTSPVHMDIGDNVSTMSFVMPAGYNQDNLPIPNNSDVTISTSPDEYVAAIQFGGFSSNENIKHQTAMLENALKEKHISYYGHFRYLGYNPPYQLFGRRNEVIVSINYNDIKQNK